VFLGLTLLGTVAGCTAVRMCGGTPIDLEATPAPAAEGGCSTCSACASVAKVGHKQRSPNALAGARVTSCLPCQHVAPTSICRRDGFEHVDTGLRA
jgi:hypothetical protein